MLMVNQGPGGALSARRCPLPSSPLNSSHKHLHHHHHHQQPILFSNTTTAPPNRTLSVPPPPLTSTKRRHPLHPTLAKPDSDTNGAATATTDNSSSTVYVGQENVPLEGVIQFDKPKSSFSSQLDKWGRIGLLAGGDVLALLLFAAIGRYSHGLSVFDTETLRTADPFIAGWFLGAYFLGGYGEDGRVIVQAQMRESVDHFIGCRSLKKFRRYKAV